VARPEPGPDGALNLMVWQCTLPGKVQVCSCTYGSFIIMRRECCIFFPGVLYDIYILSCFMLLSFGQPVMSIRLNDAGLVAHINLQLPLIRLM